MAIVHMTLWVRWAKKGALVLDSQPQVIKFTSCLPMVGSSLRLFPPLRLVAMIWLKVVLNTINQSYPFVLFLLVIVLSVLRFMDSDYPFCIFKLFLYLGESCLETRATTIPKICADLHYYTNSRVGQPELVITRQYVLPTTEDRQTQNVIRPQKMLWSYRNKLTLNELSLCHSPVILFWGNFMQNLPLMLPTMDILFRLSGFNFFHQNWATRNKISIWQPCF